MSIMSTRLYREKWHWIKYFYSYQDVSLKLCQYLQRDTFARDAVTHEYERELHRKQSLDHRYATWIASTEALSSVDPLITGTAVSHNNHLHVTSHVPASSKILSTKSASGDTLSKGKENHASSRKSNKSKDGHAKLLLAQLNLKQMEEEQELRKRQQELDSERERIQMERELLKCRSEVEQAVIVAEWDEDIAESRCSSDILSGIERQSARETVERYLKSYQPSAIADHHQPSATYSQRCRANETKVKPEIPDCKVPRPDVTDHYNIHAGHMCDSETPVRNGPSSPTPTEPKGYNAVDCYGYEYA